MSSSDIAVSVRGLSKSYAITHSIENHVTLAESLLHRLKKPFERVERETFWALKDVDFDIEKGDVVGIIGRNGAGKSTLLKILSRITEPTSGQIDLYGRVGSLLEVGTGFHPELTGRENVYLNGAILGMRRHHIDRQFDAIVDFAGVEQFLDTPVKRYSSGMYVRLAFAVAAHLDSDILVVDEVLAVGDAEFQRKCLGKMQDVAHSGRTVLFVSHHMQSVKVLCNRAMHLDGGRVTYVGDVEGGLGCYARTFGQKQPAPPNAHKRRGTGELRFVSVETNKELYSCGDDKTVAFDIRRQEPYVGKCFVSAHVVDHNGVVLLQCDSRLVDHWIDASEVYSGHITIKSPWLKAGCYRVDLFICSSGIIDWYEDACRINVLPLLPYPSTANDGATANGLVYADFAFGAGHEPGCRAQAEGPSPHFDMRSDTALQESPARVGLNRSSERGWS